MPEKILSVLPRRPDIMFPYLSFLVDASAHCGGRSTCADRRASLVDPSDKVQRDRLVGFVDLLLKDDRAKDASVVWNQLVDRGVLKYGKVLPASGATP